MTNPTPHGQVPEALNQLFEKLEDCIYEWSNYVRADDAPTTLPKYTAGAINDLRVAVTGLYLRTQQPAPATQQARDYLPLPDFDAVEQHIYGACRRYITQDMLEPIHNLIRDAIDADRAAQQGYDAARLEIESLRDEVKEYRHGAGVQKALIESLLADKPEDALDAARYRMLRRGQHLSVINGVGDTLRAEELDAAIDAARSKAKELADRWYVKHGPCCAAVTGGTSTTASLASATDPHQCQPSSA